MLPVSAEADRFRKVIHDLALHGAASRDEARALGLLSYYLTGTTAEKIVAAIKGEDK